MYGSLYKLKIKLEKNKLSTLLSDTGENVQKWTVRKKKEENSVSTFGRFRLWTCLESSPVPVKINLRP